MSAPLSGSQFHQLQMFATPHEAGNWASGDTGWLMKDTYETGVKDDASLAAMHGEIENPVLLRHIGSSKELQNGNHRVVHAMRTNRLIPVEHVEGATYDPQVKTSRGESISRDQAWRQSVGGLVK